MNALANDYSSVQDMDVVLTSERACYLWLVHRLYDGIIKCPDCESADKVYMFGNRLRHRCSTCSTDFSVRTGTILHDCKMPLLKALKPAWVLARHPKPTLRVMAKFAGTTPMTAHLFRTKFKTICAGN